MPRILKVQDSRAAEGDYPQGRTWQSGFLFSQNRHCGGRGATPVARWNIENRQ